jgi:hypothetical protein
MGTVWADRTETNPGEIGGQVQWGDRGQGGTDMRW